MKIITFAAIKGGVGKTTLTFNYGEWLAKKGHKVLLIDLDHQCNLTSAIIFTRARIRLLMLLKVAMWILSKSRKISI